MQNQMGIVAGLALALLAGCGERAVTDREWRPTMNNPPIRKVKVGKIMPVPQLQPDDVIVAVNGIGLTKRELDESLLAYDWHLRQDRRIRGGQRQSMYNNFGRQLIPSFIDMQALLWEAREKCHLEYTNIVAVVETNVIRNAQHYGITPAQYDQAVAGGNRAVRVAAEHMLWRDAYLAQVFKPTTQVADGDVSNIVRQIDAENAGIAASNAVTRARLEKVRARIVTGGEDFGTLADEFGEDPMQQRDGTGFWGVVSQSEIVGDDTARQIFALKKNEVSGILEDDDGYFIVKALEKPKREEDEKHTLTVRLARIWMVKIPLVVLADVDLMKRDLQRQFNDRQLMKHLKELRKKVEIVYPHGTNFWKVSK